MYTFYLSIIEVKLPFYWENNTKTTCEIVYKFYMGYMFLFVYAAETQFSLLFSFQ